MSSITSPAWTDSAFCSEEEELSGLTSSAVACMSREAFHRVVSMPSHRSVRTLWAASPALRLAPAGTLKECQFGGLAFQPPLEIADLVGANGENSLDLGPHVLTHGLDAPDLAIVGCGLVLDEVVEGLDQARFPGLDRSPTRW